MVKVFWSKLAACFALCFAAAVIGSFFTIPSIAGWYASLHKPSFIPPDWVFAPVWTALYALMAFSLYSFATAKSKKKTLGYALFSVQLVLNVLWSIVFFGLHNIALALMVILALEASIIACIWVFNKTNSHSAKLLIPYALWVAFATIINYAVWTMN